MRCSILTILFNFFSVFVLAVNLLEDKSDIEDLTTTFNLLLDEKKFSDLDKVFSPDVIYNPGPDPATTSPIQGLSATIGVISRVIPTTTASFFTLGTRLITFLPPFDKRGCSDFAKSVTYGTFMGFGSGNLTGEYYIILAKYVDKEIVRTKLPGFGGWRIKNREIELLVSFPPLFFFFLLQRV